MSDQTTTVFVDGPVVLTERLPDRFDQAVGIRRRWEYRDRAVRETYSVILNGNAQMICSCARLDCPHKTAVRQYYQTGEEA